MALKRPKKPPKVLITSADRGWGFPQPSNLFLPLPAFKCLLPSLPKPGSGCPWARRVRAGTPKDRRETRDLCAVSPGRLLRLCPGLWPATGAWGGREWSLQHLGNPVLPSLLVQKVPGLPAGAASGPQGSELSSAGGPCAREDAWLFDRPGVLHSQADGPSGVVVVLWFGQVIFACPSLEPAAHRGWCPQGRPSRARPFPLLPPFLGKKRGESPGGAGLQGP